MNIDFQKAEISDAVLNDITELPSVLSNLF